MIYPKLFIPGPTHVDDVTLQAMAKPQVGHRTAEYSELMSAVVTGLQKVLMTDGRVFLFSNPATGVWEASVRNSVKRGAANMVNGAFSSKWHTVTKSCGLPAEAINVEWGQPIKADDVDRALATGKFDVVTVVHNETSTGVLSPIEDIGRLVRDKYPDVILHVDAVSSMAGVEIQFDEWGLDTCFASVQKAWGLPAGFAVCGVSQRCIDRSAEMENKGYYFDFLVMDKFHQKMQTPSTPSIAHMHGLVKVLTDIESETPAGRFERHRKMAQTAHDWAYGHGQQLYPEKGYESNTMTTIRNVKEWPVQDIYAAFEERGYRMDRGYGKIRGETFRIAHMGNVMQADLDDYLKQFDSILAEMGIEK